MPLKAPGAASIAVACLVTMLSGTTAAQLRPTLEDRYDGRA
jgi:hypothetical protein